MRKRATVDETEILVCVASHAAGAYGFYREGDRVRRADIDPYSDPYWTSDGVTPLELARLRNALEGTGAAAPVPEPPPVAKVVAVKSFTATVTGAAGGSNASPGVPTMFVISEGDVFPAGHPLVQKYADAFKPFEPVKA